MVEDDDIGKRVFMDVFPDGMLQRKKRNYV